MQYQKYQTIRSQEDFYRDWTDQELPPEYRRDYVYQKYRLKCLVFQRDNFRCQNIECNAPHSSLTIHHIKFQKNGGENKVRNCVTICRSCHKGFHRGKNTLTFWGATYKIHMEEKESKRLQKEESRRIRNENAQYHGLHISWEVVKELIRWLYGEELPCSSSV